MTTEAVNVTRYFTADIVFLKERKREKVYIPELDCTIIVQELSVKQMNDLTNAKDLVGQLAQMIVDETGVPIFKTPEQIANLAEMSASISSRLFEAVNRMSATSAAGQDTLLKN